MIIADAGMRLVYRSLTGREPPMCTSPVTTEAAVVSSPDRGPPKAHASHDMAGRGVMIPSILVSIVKKAKNSPESAASPDREGLSERITARIAGRKPPTAMISFRPLSENTVNPPLLRLITGYGIPVFHYSKRREIYKCVKGGTLRILLVQSPTGRGDAPIYPVGLAYLAGRLAGHQLSGLDLSLHDDPASALTGRIGSFSPDIVAVSLRNIDDSAYPDTFWYLNGFEAVMSALADWRGSVVVGGTAFSMYPEEILGRWPRIDIGVVGEGDEAFERIVEHLDGGEKPEWLHGRTARPPRPCAGSLPLPDYGVFPASDYPGKGSVGVQTRRGCVFNCRYCTYRSISGTGFRLRPVEEVMQDIERLRQAGFDSFMFVDSVFDHPVAYYRKLLERLLETDGLPYWEAWLSESVPLDTLQLLFRAGCRWVDFSPDAITARGWKLLGKAGSHRNLWPAVKAARDAGLTVGVNFFSASPGENFAALIMKFAFMLKARLLLGWRSTFVNIGTIRLYRGAPLSEELHPGADLFRPVFYRPRGMADWFLRLFQRARKLGR